MLVGVNALGDRLAPAVRGYGVDPTYSLLVIFTVDPRTHERLQDQQAIRDEAHGWLASLDATVHGVNIRKAG